MQKDFVILSWVLVSLLALQTGFASAFLPGVVVRSFAPSSASVVPARRFVEVRPRRCEATVTWQSTDEYILDANDVNLLREVFDTYASTGEMTKEALKTVPAIAELLESGDLLPEELDEIWKETPKDGASLGADGFVQLYQMIDDLFEDDEDETDNAMTTDSVSDDSADEDSELIEIFAAIAKDGKVTKADLKKWDEVETLIDDSMLGEDEFEELWASACENSETMDEAAFLQFNDLLDSLFEFQDEDLDEVIEDTVEDESAEETTSEDTTTDDKLVEGEEDPIALFELLKSQEGVVGYKQIKRWGELREMIADQDILPEEVDEIYEKALLVSKVDGALDKEGFRTFCQAIDDLFEDDDDEEAEEKSEGDKAALTSPSLKGELVRALTLMNKDEDRLPCGLESTESEETLILDLVAEIEKEPTNLIRLKEGNVDPSDLAGEWEMLYSSSSAMKFNKGLSGIGGSFPNGQFGGLKQTLKATSVVLDVEYSEFIKVNPSASSFNVKIDGTWQLRNSVSLFTGEPSIVLSVEPNRVTYGPTSTRADHWKALGPMNLLDVTYLDDDIRIMRGNTATDSLFIFKKLD